MSRPQRMIAAMGAEHVHTISLTAAFIAGIAGSMHCFAMCGGMAGALGIRARTSAPDARAAFLRASLYQTGRIGGYTLAGLLTGALGAAVISVADVVQLALVLRVMSGIFIALVGVRLLMTWNPLAWLERLGARFWQRLRPLAQHTARQSDVRSSLLLGFLWGWLPCGLVYSMLLFAGMSGSASTGGGIMLAFGVGTLPSMLTSSLLAAQIQRIVARRWPKLVSGVVLFAFGVWMILAALHMQSGHAVH